MKNKSFRLVILLVVSSLLLGFSSIGLAQEVVKVGASPVPHAEILELLVPVLAEQGIKLEIIEFTDYVLPNLAVHEGELDANFFQHGPYLEDFNKNHRIDLVSLADVHIEPLGLYSKRITQLEQISRGANIAIPNDATNGARALLLLESAGLIKVDPKAGSTPTVFDITENKLNLKIVELEAAQLPRSLSDVTASIINTNYALSANLVPTKDAIILEDKDSPYANILAVRSKDVNSPKLLKLAEALNSDIVREFILTNYPDSVVPAF